MDKLTKKEKREQKKLEWEDKLQKEKRNNMLKKIGIWTGAVIIFSLIIWGLILATNKPISQTSVNNLPSPRKTDITLGNNNAKIILTEYADFQCPACAANYPIVKQILNEYKDKILFIYRNFPLPQHQNAEPAAYAAYAAYKQGKFLDMEDLLYENQSSWSEEQNAQNIFRQYAEQIGLDMTKYDQDVSSSETKKFIENQKLEAQTLGINSTPTFFVNKEQLQNTQGANSFKKAIENALSEK